MKPKTIQAESYSNIALIKYMGKSNAAVNSATNPSMSYTLPHLKSVVQISLAAAGPSEDGTDIWNPLEQPGCQPIVLTEKGQTKFLKHAERLKNLWGVHASLKIESANNFPADCGIASSASSFAALTLAMAKFFDRKESPLELARLSRLGSGSSCRSFFSPWCLWNGEQIEEIDLPQKNLLHMVVLIDAEKKEVSSSEAHLRVASSPQFKGREDRVDKRTEKLLSALKKNQWQEAFQITWDEFEDMHQLFETSQPAFSYRNEKSKKVLEDCQKVWNYKKDGPLVTMDAGPNIHLLFRQNQRSMFLKMKQYFSEKHPVLASE